MAQPYLAQIQPFGFGFPPKGWALCNGQTMAINQNTALFALLGTSYGGNGVQTFMLPNLQGRVPMHQGSFNGNTYTIGEIGGETNVTLQIPNLPAHVHTFNGTSSPGSRETPQAGNALGAIHNSQTGGQNGSYYAPDSSTLQPLNPGSLLQVGGGQSHSNLQPYLTINFCIALTGFFPSRN
jgi:microcystin-dependent protein